MHDFHEDFVKIKKDRKKILKWIIGSIIFLGFVIYINTFYVIVRFDELGPISKNMSIYYNGFKVGKIVRITPDKDFKHTLVKIIIISKRLKLPINTTVQLKNFANGELYLEFVYPDSPSLITLKRGSLLEGISPYGLEEFMQGQNGSGGVTDVVSSHIIQTLDATKSATDKISMFFGNSSDMIQENRKGINLAVNNTAKMTESLAKATENLNQASKKLNSAIDSSVIKSTTVNVRDSTENIKASTLDIKSTTENINNATKNMDKTMKTIDNTISEANSAAANINCITKGLNKTLSKRFGTMRIMFGTPVKTCREK